jgi:hypothetical protein
MEFEVEHLCPADLKTLPVHTKDVIELSSSAIGYRLLKGFNMNYDGDIEEYGRRVRE